MKKLLLLFLIVGLIALVVGCGEKKAEQDTTPAVEEPAMETPDTTATMEPADTTAMEMEETGGH